MLLLVYLNIQCLPQSISTTVNTDEQHSLKMPKQRRQSFAKLTAWQADLL